MENKKKCFTIDDLSLWGSHVENYFLDLLNGDYDLETAREDLKSLIGSKHDHRIKHIETNLKDGN